MRLPAAGVVAAVDEAGRLGRWVLLAYRLPREPSTPRITVWRMLERLGVARLGDGLVGLPADARTREQVDWVAQQIVEAGGAATVWLAAAGSAAQERAVADAMRAARAAEYAGVAAQAQTASMASPGERVRAVRRLRAELRRIGRRDFFPPAERDLAHAAVEALTEQTADADSARTEVAR
jgi:hypothetical protein